MINKNNYTDSDLLHFLTNITGSIYSLSQKLKNFEMKNRIPNTLCELSRTLKYYIEQEKIKSEEKNE